MKNNKNIQGFDAFNEEFNYSDIGGEDNGNGVYNEIEPLTIQEFSLLREAMYAVRTSDSPSAFQAKEFFKDQENFDIVVEKLRNLLTYGSEKH